MTYLKEKIDAGSQCVITQMVLDSEVYLDFVKICREYEDNVPVVPGIMCWNGLGGLQRMTAVCKIRVPEGMMEAAAKANTSDEVFKTWSIEFGAKMRQCCIEGGAPGLHFCTLNLEEVVLGVLEKMGLLTAEQLAQCSAGEADAKHMVSAQGICRRASPVAWKPQPAGGRNYPLQITIRPPTLWMKHTRVFFYVGRNCASVCLRAYTAVHSSLPSSSLPDHSPTRLL